MERRFAFSLFAAVALAALTGSRVGMAVEVPTAGTIITVAGTGQVGSSGDGSPATLARLDNPGASPSMPRATSSLRVIMITGCAR